MADNGEPWDILNRSVAFAAKVKQAEELRGGVIIDVATPKQARIAEKSGARAVVVVERVAYGISAQGSVTGMSDPAGIDAIKRSVSIPVFAKAPIGHDVQAQIFQEMGIDYVDESELLSPIDEQYHINKHNYKMPFVCGCSNLGEVLHRVGEGAAMIRTKGEHPTDAVRHVRTIQEGIHSLCNMDDNEVCNYTRMIAAPYDLVMQTKQQGRLPVVQFAAGGIANPQDAALMMLRGCDGVFVESAIFRSRDPALIARAIVKAVAHYSDQRMLVEATWGLGEPGGDGYYNSIVERFAALWK